MLLHRDSKWWDAFFLGIAQYISTASKDPSTQVGAVIVEPNNHIVSVGFNGFPPGVQDTSERLNERALKYDLVLHAEHNAVLIAERSRLKGAILYTWPFLPCIRCAMMLIQAGIVEVVAPEYTGPRLEAWKADFEKTRTYLAEAGVKVREIQLPLPSDNKCACGRELRLRCTVCDS